VSTSIEEVTVPDTYAQLWDRWLEMWNGDYTIADDIISPGVRCHLAAYGMPDSAAINSPRAMVALVDGFRSSFEHARLVTEVGPFAGGGFLMGRWNFTGVWQSGRPPGATAAAGTHVRFAGVDILRLDGGRIVEYWLSDNLIDLYGQLGAIRNSA
jgi:hypothetical protein